MAEARATSRNGTARTPSKEMWSACLLCSSVCAKCPRPRTNVSVILRRAPCASRCERKRRRLAPQQPPRSGSTPSLIGENPRSMTLPIKRKLTILQGATFRKRWTWKPGGVPMDFTGCKARMQVRAEIDSTVVHAVFDHHRTAGSSWARSLEPSTCISARSTPLSSPGRAGCSTLKSSTPLTLTKWTA